MGHRCCTKQKVKRGLWSPEEDEKLTRHITTHGHACWSSVPKLAGLQRCGKSCRLRWINYLRPDLKRGTFTAQEEQIIIDVHRILGNRWAQIAKHLPGRTDNEVKNFWNSCIKKKLISKGLDPKTHNLISSNSSHRQRKKHYSHDHNKSSSTRSARNNPPRSQAQPQPMISVFTVVDNSQPQVRTTARDNNSKQVLSPPFAVLPAPITPHINPDQPHHQTIPIPMPTASELLYQYDQNSTTTSITTNSVWTLNKDDDDQNNSHHHDHHDDFINEFPCGCGSSNIGITSLTSSSPCSVNPAAGFCLASMDSNSIWPGTSTTVGETFGSAGQEPLLLQLQNPPHKEKINIQQQLDENGNPKSDHHMELDTPMFDTSTFDLLHFVDSNLTSIDDLAWNF